MNELTCRQQHNLIFLRKSQLVSAGTGSESRQSGSRVHKYNDYPIYFSEQQNFCQKGNTAFPRIATLNPSHHRSSAYIPTQPRNKLLQVTTKKRTDKKEAAGPTENPQGLKGHTLNPILEDPRSQRGRHCVCTNGLGRIWAVQGHLLLPFYGT